LTFNPQFLDFVRHHGFSVHPCTPGRANEKGRVERVIRDVKDFLPVDPCQDLQEVNRKVSLWRQERNQRVHRSTEKRPIDLLKEEKLKPLPQIPYSPHQVLRSLISKTGFIEFDTNRYSAPSSFSEASCELLVYPEYVEIWVKGKRVARHPRSFDRKQKIEDPSHREKLLQITPHFKAKRIYQLMNRMDRSVASFLGEAEADGQDPMEVAHELFRLLTRSSKASFSPPSGGKRFEGLQGQIPSESPSARQGRPEQPVHPQNPQLLNITYPGRSLKDYDNLI